MSRVYWFNIQIQTYLRNDTNPQSDKMYFWTDQYWDEFYYSLGDIHISDTWR